MITKIRMALGGNEAGKEIAVLGLTFKPQTDDMRDAPALSILPKLIENGAKIRAHDPKGMEAAKPLLPGEVVYCNDIFETIKAVDAIVLMTEWHEYRGLPLDKIRKEMKGNVFIDLRNVYEPATMRSKGFDYYCVGRK